MTRMEVDCNLKLIIVCSSSEKSLSIFLSVFWILTSKLTLWMMYYSVNDTGILGKRGSWPGFDSRTRRHIWVEFVVGSLFCSERFFSGYSGFPLSSKINIWFDLICAELSWVDLNWFKKGIPSIGITSGISCSWHWWKNTSIISIIIRNSECSFQESNLRPFDY